jgi:hypothetical protein
MSSENNMRVGKPQTHTSTPSHSPHTPEGNTPGRTEKQRGYDAPNESTAARSTGINPKDRNPIDPKMPNLSPA